MKLVYRASDINEANIVSGMLHSYGIESHVGGYYLQGGVGELAAQDFANVHVPDEDFELAKSIITEYENASDNVNINRAKRSSTKLILNAVLFVLVIIIIFYFLVTS